MMTGNVFSFFGGALKSSRSALNQHAMRVDAATLSTTRFFRNRAQHRRFLQELAGPTVLVAGVSRGCEAYSLAVEAELTGRRLCIEGIDILGGNIRRARRKRYPHTDFVDFDGVHHLDDPALRPFFSGATGQIRVRAERVNSTISFSRSDLFDIGRPYDGIVCNNVLVHFARQSAERALRRLVSCLKPNGVLAVGGVDIGLLAEIAPQLALVPILDDVDAIWDGWKGDRLTYAQNPSCYVSMPPLDRSLPDWRFRFCTLFRRARG